MRTKLVTGAAAGVVAGALAIGLGLLPAQAAPGPAADAAKPSASSASPATASPSATQSPAATATPPSFTATPDRTFDAFDAHQGVAVDKKYFYAVNNQSITKVDRATGQPVLQFVSADDGPIIHMDSATVVGDKLYVAASDYDSAPEESDVEIFDTKTMKHVGTFSFGIERGSLTWLDRHDGAWWGGFANYDEVPDGQTQPYGGTENTQIVKMDDSFRIEQAWSVPDEILDRFKPMSNSGGSWGPDGRLWITGHDLDEAYVMELPKAGTELQWDATVTLPNVEGQAIAWDRSGGKPTLWAIKRSTSQVLSFTVPYATIPRPTTNPFEVLGPGQFQE
jgi:hypothetical protein